MFVKVLRLSQEETRELLREKCVVFRWLRDERGRKRFSHTQLGVWARVCGGSQVHFAFAIRHCLTPSHPPVHVWSISRVGLSLCVFSFAIWKYHWIYNL